MAFPTEEFLRHVMLSGGEETNSPDWIVEWKKIKKLDELTFNSSPEGLRPGFEAAGGNPLRHAVVAGDEAAFDQLVSEGYKPDANMMRFLVEDAVQFSNASSEQHTTMLNKMMEAGADPTRAVEWPNGSESAIEHAERFSGHEVARAMSACMRRGALTQSAERARPQDDLADMDEVEARQSRSRRM